MKVSKLHEDSALGCPAAHEGSKLHEGRSRAVQPPCRVSKRRREGRVLRGCLLHARVGLERVTGDPQHEGATLRKGGGGSTPGFTMLLWGNGGPEDFCTIRVAGKRGF